MAEMYETLQTETKQMKYLKYLTILVVILFLTLVGVVVYILVDQPTCEAPVDLCTTPECVSLANEVIASINTSVDPCDDFYHYSCDGWISRNSWRLIDDGEYSQFADVEETLKKNFLDEMFWYENPTLIDPEPVKNAKTFFDTCFKSTTTKDDLIGSELLNQFISKVNFSTEDSEWDSEVSTQFSEAIAWLNQRDWNSLFRMTVYFENDVSLQQNSDFWTTYKENNTKFCETVNKTFLPLFMEIYDMNETATEKWSEDACEFAEEIKKMGDYPADYLNVGTLYSNYFTSDNFTIFQQNIVRDSLALNLTEMIYKTFRSKNVSEVYYFGDPDINYLRNLSFALNDYEPFAVQLYIFANVLWYYLDFEDSWQDTQDVSRRDFCYQWTVDQFPFVFGYITGNTLYSEEKFSDVTELVSNVQNNGILELIKNADWLDDDSLENAQKKAELMELYVGYPESVSDSAGITDYYKDVAEMDSKDPWLTNVQKMNNWYANQTVGSFTNNVFQILDEWPIIFSQKDAFRYWLTGVNAFYYPGPPVDGANFFTIPATISQEPFFNSEYPSAVNFGGLGSVCGHEMSHGFDPNGFQYSYNGTDVGSILSDDDTTYYFDEIECYIQQYDALPVRRNDDLFDNGTRTQTENVADNAGLRASYLAWRTYKSGTDGKNEKTVLPGVDLTEKQLFFWSWAHLWCDVNRPDVFKNYTNEHSPHWTRVIGSLQNSQEFQDAFSCVPEEDFMSSEDKCTLW